MIGDRVLMLLLVKVFAIGKLAPLLGKEVAGAPGLRSVRIGGVESNTFAFDMTGISLCLLSNE
jgi:hypothetical protein